MNYVNVWIALSQQALAEFVDKKNNPDTYTGQLDDATFTTLSRMVHAGVVQKMFKSPKIGAKTYTLFSLYVEKDQEVRDTFDRLAANWPNHFVILGVWHRDGRQHGTQWELDGEGVRTGGVTGVPTYPLAVDSWRFMPGDPVDNSGMEDINLLAGQEPRRFA